ncbi:hypothetical protein M1O14_00915 [Dehalococcoidia bacterium]|nr:hypothetical protein [Dehalococcoidia bacterium]
MKKELSVAILALLVVSLVAVGCPPLYLQREPGPAPPGPFPPPDKEWSRTFGGRERSVAQSVQQTRDGGFIIVGWREGAGEFDYDIWLVKSDEKGNKEWSRTFGGPHSDKAHSVQQTVDGGFIIVGDTASFGAGSNDAWLIKTDGEGNKEWSRIFGGLDADRARSVQQTRDGGFIIVGWTDSFGPGDIWLIKTDQEGNKEWSRTFGGRITDHGWSVRETLDGGFIITGTLYRGGPRYGDLWLIRTDEHGDKEWCRTFDRGGGETGHSVQQTRDGGFIIAAQVYPPFIGRSDLWLIKTDQEGNKEWSRSFGGWGSEGLPSVQQTRDGGFIIVASTESFGAGKSDLWLIKTDQEGDKEWSRTFGGREREGGSSVQQTACGGFIIAGTTNSFGAGKSDFWLIKLAPEHAILPVS